MKHNNEPWNSALSKHEGLEGYVKELEKANTQLEITNYFLMINHYLNHNENKCEAQKIENKKEKVLTEY